MIERRMLRERRFPPALIPILAGLKVNPRPGSYCVVKLPSGAAIPEGEDWNRRLSLGAGEDSESFILPESQWAEVEKGANDADVERGFRVLSMSPVPEGHEGNFMAVVTGMLADALVNARPIWSPGRFDLIVKSTELKAAREAVDLIVHRAKGRHRSS